MTGDEKRIRLTLSLLPETFAICRLPPDAEIPAWATRGEFHSITRTRAELSIVCAQENVPDGVQCDKGWRCLRVEGKLDLALTGILASLLAPLADAGIAILALSTYDTDYVMVKAENLERALHVLSAAGHLVIAKGREKRERARKHESAKVGQVNPPCTPAHHHR